jgi:hypothetical protein
MTFFHYSQNNSGGSFDHSKANGIGYAVIIEASNADEANERAENIGLYFNGCDTGLDCDCCGDRWYPAYGEGDPVPMIYGQTIEEASKSRFNWWGLPVYVHYLDGTIKEWTHAAKK